MMLRNQRTWMLLPALATAAALLHGQAQEEPRQVIRTGTDVVLVDVSVRDGGRAVAGLRAEDFVLTDNGVRQRIESVEATTVPIDVTLVLDLSGNPRGVWAKPTPASKTINAVQAEVGEVTKLLRPDDRVRVLAIDTRVQQLWPMQSARSMTPVTSVESDGQASLFDALATALLQPVEPARRHVVIARTKGIDTISSVDAQGVRALAQRTDALVHIVAMESAGEVDRQLWQFQCAHMGFCWPTRKFWIPFARHLWQPPSQEFGPRPGYELTADGVAISEAAAGTGGALHKAIAITVPSLTGTFRKAFEDFRNGYMLRYTPENVARAGWHAIEVKVSRSRSFTVRSRRGYLVEEPAPAPAPGPVPELPRTLRELTDAYGRGAYRQVVSGLRQTDDPERLLRDFQDAGNPWPATPHREAAFALEVVEPALFSVRNQVRDAGFELLTRFSRLIRHPIEPEMFERYWFFAALTLLEGSLRPAVTEEFVNRAVERFPDEPRFVLSRAIAADQRWMRAQGPNAGGLPGPAHPDSVESRYAAAMVFPETGAEARIRLAWFLHCAGKPAEALTLLTDAAVQSTTETALRYLRQLFLGHVLVALDRHDDGVAAFREAMKILPSSQSARVSLMNVLLARGDRAGAEELAERVQSETGDELDPWWMYWQGQYRLHPVAMAKLRELIQ